MLISEIEAQLKALREKHGDLPCFIQDREQACYTKEISPNCLNVGNNVNYCVQANGEWGIIETWGLKIGARI